MRFDLVDLVLEGLFSLPLESEDFVKKPHILSNADGQTLSLASLPDLTRATLHYAAAKRKTDYRVASSLLHAIIQTVEVEKLALQFTQLIFDRLQVAFPEFKDLSPHDLIFRIYSEYSNRPVDEIVASSKSAVERVAESWRERCEAHEDTLTNEQIADFYASFEFPIMCTFRKILRGSLSVAQAALPLHVAQQFKPTAAFDFGGNSGALTTALALAGIKRVLLTDQSRSLLDFAKWRDRRMNIENVEYVDVKKLENQLTSFAGLFDFGCCVEVLEHVADVEAAMTILRRLMRENGILFLSTSFGQYPFPTHLRRNVVYAGNEDELLRRHGFERVPVAFPVPTRGNERLYRKVSGGSA